jgi:hypothetical protein
VKDKLKLLALLSLLLTTPALADEVTVTGDAKYGDDFSLFDFGNGSNLSISNHWPTNVSFIFGISTTIVTVPANFGPGFSFGDYNGIHANLLVGYMTIQGQTGVVDVPVPVTVTAHVVGYFLPTLQDFNILNLGPELFTVDLTGTGFGTLHGFIREGGPFLYADYTYSGMAAVTTPEPTSLVLLLTGGVWVGMGYWRRRVA